MKRYITSSKYPELKGLFLAKTLYHSESKSDDVEIKGKLGMKRFIKSSQATNANDKELITVNLKGDTCALYKETYAYGGGIALFLYNLTKNDDWGDLTINLPGLNGMFLQDYISNDTVNAMKNIFTVLGKFPYNYGEYRMIGLKPGIKDKIPTWDELVELVQE